MTERGAPSLDLATLRAQLAQKKGPHYWRSLDELAQTPSFLALLNEEFPSFARTAEAAVDRTLQEIGLAGVLEREHVTPTTMRAFQFLYPVASITKVEKKDAAGDWQTLPADEWTLSGTIEERHVIVLAVQHLSGSS